MQRCGQRLMVYLAQNIWEEVWMAMMLDRARLDHEVEGAQGSMAIKTKTGVDRLNN